MSIAESHPFVRLHAFFERARAGGRVYAAQGASGEGDRFVLADGSTAKVGMSGSLPVWFLIEVPTHGMVHITPQTKLVSVILQKTDAYLRRNGL